MIRICNKITMKPKEMKSKTWRKKCARELFQLDFHCGKMRFAMLDAATMNYLKWLDRIFLFFLILVFAFVIHCQQIYIIFFLRNHQIKNWAIFLYELLNSYFGTLIQNESQFNIRIERNIQIKSNKRITINFLLSVEKSTLVPSFDYYVLIIIIINWPKLIRL